MALSDTRIHQIELLLTLDYLLNYTDEFNPATQIDICEHARKYGLKFDKNAKTGNQVRRQRISECLKFLRQITDDFTDDIPFVLETTDSGKYYIEQRHGLNENQVAKILAAISNDKYTKDEDVNFLIDRILSAFSTSEENRRIIDSEYKRLLRGGKKYDKETIRKINLIERAYREGKMIKIKFSIIDPDNKKVVDYFFWYRVYLIKEFHNKPYAFMLPIGQINVDEKIGRLQFFNGFLYEPIEKIDVANDSDRNVLCDDLDEHRDFEQLFRKTCPNQARKYGTIDNMLEQNILPNGGKACIVSSYFNLGLKDILRRSFEEFFSESFRYQETNMIAGIENQIKDFVGSMDNWQIVTEEPQKNEYPKYGLVNISVDNNSFKSWLLSDPHGDGRVCIADMLTIIKPSSLNEELAEYHYFQLMKRTKYLRESLKRNLVRTIDIKPNIKKEDDTGLEDDLYIESEYTKQLDNSLATKENLMLFGLTGTGKTSIVKSWLNHNKDKVNGYYIDAAKFQKCSGGIREKNGLTLFGQVFTSEAIDNMLDLPNRVIVVDNYHLLPDNLKNHILLLCDGYVVDDREESGFKKLDNLEFVCLIKTTGI